MTAAPVEAAGYRSKPAIAGALARYRVMAIIVSVSLILFCVGIPLQVAGHSGLVDVVGVVHGWVFFPLYVVAGLDLSVRMRWSVPAILSVLVAGIVPVGSFYVEHRVRTNVQAHLSL